MLQRFTQVGEFYTMSKPEGVKNSDVGAMDIMLYDEETDKFTRISYRSALMATGLVVHEDVNASPPKMDLKTLIDGGTRADGTVVAADADAYKTGANDIVLEGGTTLEDWVKAAIALVTANESAAGNTAAYGVDAPIILSRPFIEHAMLSAVLTVSGQDTGATLFGPSDMQASANTHQSSQRFQNTCRAPTHTDCATFVYFPQISANTSVKTIEGAPAIVFLFPHRTFPSLPRFAVPTLRPRAFAQATTLAISSRSSPSRRTFL